MGEEPATRKRFSGTDDELIAALALKSPTDVKYAEDSSTPVDHKLLKSQVTRLVRLRGLQKKPFVQAVANPEVPRNYRG